MTVPLYAVVLFFIGFLGVFITCALVAPIAVIWAFAALMMPLLCLAAMAPIERANDA